MPYNAMSNPFLDRADELSSALARFRLAADDLWALVDDCISVLPGKFDIEKSYNPFEAIRDLRTTVAAMRSFFETVCDDHENLDARERGLRRSLDGFEYHIDSSAMKYGLNSLPNELLSRIFFRVASNLKATVALSHVCQRFRSIVNGTPTLWNRFRLSTTWKEDQVLAVAERHGSCGSRVVIRDKYAHLDPGAAVAILSLSDRLVELSIDGLDKQNFDRIRPRLRSEPIHFPRLRVLTSRESVNIVLLHPEEISDMPSLQVLEADFIPHKSQAGSLTKLTLHLDPVSRLSELIVFLSSATVLVELTLCVKSTYERQEMIEQADVCLPKLVDLCFIIEYDGGVRTASTIASKIRAPSLRVLRLESYQGGLGNAITQSIINSNSSFIELHLAEFCCVDLRHIPAQVETLTLGQMRGIYNQVVKCSGSVNSHSLRLIRFDSWYTGQLYYYRVNLRNVLHDAGLDMVQIEFADCGGCKPGTYSLEDVDLAFSG